MACGSVGTELRAASLRRISRSMLRTCPYARRIRTDTSVTTHARVGIDTQARGERTVASSCDVALVAPNELRTQSLSLGPVQLSPAPTYKPDRPSGRSKLAPMPTQAHVRLGGYNFAGPNGVRPPAPLVRNPT